MMHATLALALHYCNLGWPVLPLHYITDVGTCSCGGPTVNPKCKPGKHPFATLAAQGVKSATTDPATAQKWFDGRPYNIGVATGPESGIFVLDRDDKDGGAESLQKLEAQHGALTPTLIQRTGNGAHYVFRLPSGLDLRNSQKKLGAGLDTRGFGGYICAPPSVHQSGRTYAWIDSEFPTLDKIADPPSWLINLLQSTTAKPKQSIMTPIASPNGEFHWPDKIHDGEGREDFLLRAAGHLRSKGIDQKLIEPILIDYNRSRIHPPLTEDEVLDRARRYQGLSVAEISSNVDWPDPEPLNDQLRPVEKFDFNLLPSTLRPWVEDASERMGCAPDFIAVTILVAAGNVIGNRIGVHPKASDRDWIEYPNLWGAVVGRPSVMKSPAITQGLLPLRALEDRARSKFGAAYHQFEIAQKQHEEDLAEHRRQRRQKSASTNSQAPTPPVAPIEKRYVVVDTTVEALGVVCKNNPQGVLAFRDELSGLLAKLSEEGEETHRAFYLQAWNGSGAYSFDRITRASLYIPKLCLSMLGGIQPSRLQGLVSNTVRGGQQDDGLLARIQLIVYPDSDVESYVDRTPRIEAAKAAFELFDYLDQLTPESVGAIRPIGSDAGILGFTPDAQPEFAKWLQAHQQHLRSANMHPAEESHRSKYRKLIPALALLLHLAERRSGPIQLDSFLKALDWQRYLQSHARRIYTLAQRQGMQQAESLANRIRAGKLKDGFTCRDVYQQGWTGLVTPDDVQGAIKILLDHQWLRAVEERTGGRPTTKYIINPLLNGRTS